LFAFLFVHRLSMASFRNAGSYPQGVYSLLYSPGVSLSRAQIRKSEKMPMQNRKAGRKENRRKCGEIREKDGANASKIGGMGVEAPLRPL